MVDKQALMRIAAETLCDLRTVTKAYAGEPVTMATRQRIRNAAEALRLPMPPEPTSKVPGFSGS
jgi:DNA-binding LacI/PurR family transcriptional regulator